jgi:hypothetical protein
MHKLASAYIGVAMFSMSNKIAHKRTSEGLIDETGLVVSAQSSTEITSTHMKRCTPDEDVLFSRMKKMIQLFVKLLQVAGVDLTISK